MRKTTAMATLPDAPARRGFVRAVAGVGLAAVAGSPKPGLAANASRKLAAHAVPRDFSAY
jgi:hypothetical protein